MKSSAMGRYGLSQIEPSHAGFNHPWEASWAVLKWVKALMRGLYPTYSYWTS